MDQRNVRERLGKVTEQPLPLGIVLFREQADVVCKRYQPLKQFARLLLPPDQVEVRGEPEAARQKNAFAARKSVA